MVRRGGPGPGPGTAVAAAEHIVKNEDRLGAPPQRHSNGIRDRLRCRRKCQPRRHKTDRIWQRTAAGVRRSGARGGLVDKTACPDFSPCAGLQQRIGRQQRTAAAGRRGEDRRLQPAQRSPGRAEAVSIPDRPGRRHVHCTLSGQRPVRAAGGKRIRPVASRPDAAWS